MEEIKLAVMPGHLRRLADGNTITIKPEMVGSGIPLRIHPMTAKKIKRAHRAGKACRMCMSQAEIEASGGRVTWKGFQRGLKRGWDFYKKHVRPIVGPLIRKGLKEAVEKGLPAAAASLGAPELAMLTPEVSKAVDQIGDATQGFGMKEDLRKAGRAIKKYYKKELQPTISPLITKQLQKGARKGSKALAKRFKMPKIEEYGEVFAQESIPAFQRLVGYGYYGPNAYPQPTGMGLYMAGGAVGSVYPPNTLIYAQSPALTNIADVGNAQYGQHFVRLP